MGWILVHQSLAQGYNFGFESHHLSDIFVISHPLLLMAHNDSIDILPS